MAAADARRAPGLNGRAYTAGDRVSLPTGGTMDKVEMYGWEVVDKPGKYQRIPKQQLNVDHDYQRDHVNHPRVNRIAAKWSWVRLGCLSVARRPDGSFWVFDGQHRKLAADKRSDVHELPCMVFASAGPVDESRLFLDVNSDRGPVQMIDRFKSLLAQKDATAEAVDRMVRADGYQIVRGGHEFTVQCVGMIYRIVKMDPAAAAVAWAAAVEIYAGEPVQDRVISGLFTVERYLRKIDAGSLADAKFRPCVARLTHAALAKSITQAVEFMGKSGEKAYGEGVLRLLNKGRRKPVPSLYAEVTEDE